MELITGTIEALSSNGAGIMKKEGFVFFVPFTAPQEQIACQVIDVKKKFGHAKLNKILKKGEDRTEPKCPYFGVCGGCQLQHLTYVAQIKNKQQWIKDALTRIGKFEDIHVNEVIPSENIYGYRRHISLSVINNKVGYFGFDENSFVEVNECPIFSVDENLFNVLRTLVSQFESCEEKAKVTVLKQEDNFILHFHFKTLPFNAKLLTETLLKEKTEIKGVILSSKKGVLKFGLTENSYSIDHLNFQFTSDLFMQNNREQSKNIYRHLVKIAKESSPTKILDLYCGIGISSLLLAKEGFDVTGIESNPQSIKMAKKNAENNGLKNKTNFLHAAVENVLKNIEIPEFVIINPPREGLDKEVIGVLRKKLPEKIVYISCMPSTLARDLHLLGKENYTIEECQPYDMFPQTIHVETVIVLKRKTPRASALGS